MESLSALAKPLLTVGKALIPLVKRLQAEHQAGADSANVKSALLDAVLDDALNRLEDIEAHDSWWRELLQRAGTAYVRPACLATPSVRNTASRGYCAKSRSGRANGGIQKFA